MASRPRTLYEKIWDAHVVEMRDDGTALIYIDRHLVHEVTSPQAFEALKVAGRPVRRPELTLAVPETTETLGLITNANALLDRGDVKGARRKTVASESSDVCSGFSKTCPPMRRWVKTLPLKKFWLLLNFDI